MRVAIIASNFLPLSKGTKKGTEIITLTLINSLHKLQKTERELSVSVFASGDSQIPFKLESVSPISTSKDKNLVKNNKHVLYELALISKAISMQDNYDLFHINIGDGDISLPFATFSKKPLLITLHHTLEEPYIAKYFSLFNDLKHIFFVAASEYQRKLIPQLNYIETIYHGIDLDEGFDLDLVGGDDLMWAGRAMPKKGPEVALRISSQTGKAINLFAIPKKEYEQWFKEEVVEKAKNQTSVYFSYSRTQLIPFFQKSKAFIFPGLYEEAFALVLIESMACGTPIVAYAKGSVPEIVKDGETGFIVNSTDDDIRGDWIIKKTGTEGLREAIEKIYSLSEKEYLKMRQNCRAQVEKHFTAEKMAEKYEAVYQKLLKGSGSLA